MTTLFEKQPSEVLDYVFNYTSWLTSKADTAVSYVVLTPDGSGVTIDSDEMTSPGIIQVFVSGGVHGTRNKVTCRLTTAAGRVKEADFILKIKEA